jgi:uncharacterized protein (DUF427 family)
VQKYSVNLTEDAENDIAELMAFYEELVDTESAVKFFDEAMFPGFNPGNKAVKASTCNYQGQANIDNKSSHKL